MRVTSADELYELANGTVGAVGTVTIEEDGQAPHQELAIGIILEDGQRRVISLGPECWLFDADKDQGFAEGPEPEEREKN